MGAHTSDGSVIIDTELNSDNIDKDLQKLILKLANMNLKIEKQTRDVQGLQKAYDDLVAGTRKGADEIGLEKALARTQARINMMLSDKSGIGIISKSINEAIQKNTTINPNIGDTEIGKEFLNLTQKATELKQRLSEIKINPATSTEAQDLLFKINTMNNNIKIMQIDAEQASEKINNMGKSTSGMENFSSKVNEVKEDLNRLSETKGLEKVSEQTKGVVAGFKNTIPHAIKFRNVLLGIGEVAKRMGGFFVNAFNQVRSSANNGTSAIEYFGRRILRLAGTAMIFNLFRHGFLNLRHAIGNLIHHDDMLSQSLENIKANLLTAFAPIWYACLPAIQALGQALSWVSSLIASVVSALFGKTITQSQKMAQGIYASSQATKKLKTNLGKAKKEAKETNKVLASFDKINVLSDKKPKSALGKVDKKNLDSTQGDLNSPGGGLKPLKVPVLFEFQEQNKELIDKITQIFQNMGRIVKPIIKGIVDDVKWLWDQVFKNKEESWLDWLNNSLKGIADFIEDHPTFKDFLVSMAEGFLVLGAAILVFNAAAALMGLVNPWFLLIGASIGLIIFLIKDWDKICAWFSKQWEKFVNFLVENWEGLLFALGAFLGVWNPIILLITLGIIGIIELVKHWGDITTWLTSKWDEFTSWFDKNVTEPIKNFWANVEKGWKSGINGILGYVERFINRIISGINFLIDKLNQVNINMPGWLGGGSFGFNINRMGNVSMPRLEEGAVLKGGNPFLAWVNDQPTGKTNIETPLSTMIDAFRVAMKDMGNNQQPINIQASGNISELIRFLNFKIKQEQGLQGTNFVTGDSWA